MKKMLSIFGQSLLSREQMKGIKGGNMDCYQISCGEGNYVVGTIDVTSCSLEESIYIQLCTSNWPGSEYDSCMKV